MDPKSLANTTEQELADLRVAVAKNARNLAESAVVTNTIAARPSADSARTDAAPVPPRYV